MEKSRTLGTSAQTIKAPENYQYKHELLEVLQMPELDMEFTEQLLKDNPTRPESVLQFSIPEGKLFYPEPFIASPSYIHTDLPFLHIFQYWYWLWFMFIFLICFFFISFLTAVRWCNLRTKPRRETRGVSRSKCGDLITACVPVSWAISIIVNESTDAIDLNDGFGTAELVVGVRAYQWGWEYYYPKSIDLNYNVRASYSSFVGNSIAYTGSSAKNISSNFLWRMYQNEATDGVISPAHALLIPQDGSGIVNFLNFKDLGLNTLRESSAFAKIRNFTKTYSTSLTHNNAEFTAKYQHLSTLYLNENDFLDAHSFGVLKQHGVSSISSLGNGSAGVLLDLPSFERFLNSTTLGNSDSFKATEQVPNLPTSETKLAAFTAPKDAPRLLNFLSTSSLLSNSTASRLSNYPTLPSSVDDNSDKDNLAHLQTQLASPKIYPSLLRNNNTSFSTLTPFDTSSTTTPFAELTLLNKSTNSRTFSLNGPNSRVLLNDQSSRNVPTSSLRVADLNLSVGRNALTSNLNLTERANRFVSPFYSAVHEESGYVDVPLSSKSFSIETLSHTPHPAVVSTSSTGSNSLSYDSTFSKGVQSHYAPLNTLITRTTTNRKSQVGDVFIGSREKTPKSINTAYWDTFWTATDSSNRLVASLKGSAAQTSFTLPLFQTYVDYDFRNDQALDILEELFWEHPLSSYSLYDYIEMRKGVTVSSTTTPKEMQLITYPTDQTFGLGSTSAELDMFLLKDLSTIGLSYGSNIQMDDYLPNPKSLITPNVALIPFYADISDLDDSFANLKQMSQFTNYVSTPAVTHLPTKLGIRSYLSVFNTFRSDFTDFNWLSSYGNVAHISTPLTADFDGTGTGHPLRLSNTASLRLPVRNSIVTTNAFQKVFKARLDESRAHVQADSFADLSLSQPFLSDHKVPYLQTLGKNKRSFFETPFYFSTPHTLSSVTTPLTASLNTPPYSFPFLSAKTSDTARFTWIDWFSKWKYIEVQPSSVSKYSTLGVPYLRRPFDFNSNVGDKFQDTELYFTRIARSRRNYLTNWSYSPLNYNKSYMWNSLSRFDSFLLHASSSLSSTKATCDNMYWYWSTPTFSKTDLPCLNFSSSGNDVYSKSTWRPRVSIQSYYYNVSKLIDVLSKREYLYRLFLENSMALPSLPQKLCATPNNPLFQELKSSFSFTDPAAFSSEYSRDFIYGSPEFIKSIFLKQSFKSLFSVAQNVSTDIDILTNFSPLYFFTDGNLGRGNNPELYKSQFRPLRKGISSMLRLHATGAVAMPVEIRLQVLASSRDVIHSWSIPSAHIKIDCVPGYTSHRIMKFLLTGVYWGQCQEICGRYHHWMPIVVYFMKPDLFILWCSHFVMIPANHEHPNAANNWFAQFKPLN